MVLSNKKKIGFALFLVIAAGALSYWSYLIGVATSQQAFASCYMAMIQNQHECLENDDIKCSKLLNNVMSDIMNIQLKALEESKLAGGYQVIIDEYSDWYKAVKKKNEK